MNTQLFYKTWKTTNHRQLTAEDFLLYAISKSVYLSTKRELNLTEQHELTTSIVFSAFRPVTNRQCLLNGHQPFIKLNKAISYLLWQIHSRNKAAERGELDLVQGNKLSDAFTLKDLQYLKNCLLEIQETARKRTEEIFSTPK